MSLSRLSISSSLARLRPIEPPPQKWPASAEADTAAIAVTSDSAPRVPKEPLTSAFAPKVREVANRRPCRRKSWDLTRIPSIAPDSPGARLRRPRL
jgi:hypothetical protein